MNKTLRILKYRLNQATIQDVPLPGGAKILSVQLQHDEPVLWALCDPDAPVAPRRIVSALTGDRLDVGADNFRHIATLQYDGGVFIKHLFEVTASEG